jgi:multimeric flavodoxin WrbA
LKILSFLGSPRIKGNTATILNQLEETMDSSVDYERINLIDYEINHCIGCNYCNTGDFSCVFDDDMTALYQKIAAADIIILATPIYFNSVTSVMKTMIDRCQRFYSMKVNHKIQLKKKKGILIATAGSTDSDAFIGFEKIANYFFKSINGAIVYQLLTNDTDNGLKMSAINDSIKEICSIFKEE